jgi:SAM-dependent methyltransferase
MNEAWKDFWADSDRGGGGPNPRWRGIETSQRKFWTDFAAGLPKQAKVLDLATGDGRVMGWLLAARRDLKLTGIDFAERLPPAPRGTKSRSGVNMEAVPFPDESHDAVVSQFGVEYGDVPQVVREVSRVLKSRGRVGFIMHRGDGSILEHNRPRRSALKWVLDEADMFAKARAGLNLRQLGIAVPPAVAAGPVEAASRFGRDSVAWEVCEAISQTFALGRADPPSEIEKVLRELERKARNEIGRIESLDRACERISDRKQLLASFTAEGLSLVHEGPLNEHATDRVFGHGWMLRKN